MPHPPPLRRDVDKQKRQCACPGPCCGTQAYDEMFEAMKGKFLGGNVTEHYLEQIHIKWKRIAAEIR